MEGVQIFVEITSVGNAVELDSCAGKRVDVGLLQVSFCDFKALRFALAPRRHGFWCTYPRATRVMHCLAAAFEINTWIR
jgi:hypothetical protein